MDAKGGSRGDKVSVFKEPQVSAGRPTIKQADEFKPREPWSLPEEGIRSWVRFGRRVCQQRSCRDEFENFLLFQTPFFSLINLCAFLSLFLPSSLFFMYSLP